ncbi:MAG TPA: hypothetical protein H9825_01360 [Candidatus Sphingobacterium stercorigallinarum]|nr:hypothetical protein [Candidatus Sphingobacterium stercorigallinarum]
MNNKFLYTLLTLCSVVLFVSCEMDDNEPILNQSISRLYVSYSEYNPDVQQQAVQNVRVITNSDSTVFGEGKLATSFVSPAHGGGTIHFHPAARYVFHSSSNVGRADTNIYSLQVGETGGLKVGGKIANEKLTNIRGLVFHPSLDKLYSVRVTNDSSLVYVFNLPRGINRHVHPSQTFVIAENRNIWDAAIWKSELYLSRSGENGGVDVYSELVTTRDTLLLNQEPRVALTIAGTQNIRGMSLDTVNNMLAVTDFSSAGGETKGRVLLFENFSELAASTGTISPTRVIEGATTGLQQPVDVDLDFREGSEFLYVADAQARKVFRFKKADSGDVAPDQVYENGLTPISLSLDARD